MADNVAITEGSGTNVAADDIAGVKYQRVKLVIGADGVNDGDVASGNPMPVTGTVTANIGTVSTLATAAKQDTGNTSVASIDTKTPALGQALATASVPVVLTAAQITTLTPPAAITGFATASNQTDKSQFTKLTDGTDTALITASGEQNVLATAQPGVDIGDVTINNASGASAVNIQDGGNSLTVDYATTGSGTATGALRVELPTNGTGVVGLNAGTNAIGKLAANSGVDIGDVDVTSAVITGGGIADDATTPGNPIMIGGKAVETDGTDPTSVSAEDDVAIFRTDRNRRVLVNKSHPNLWSVNDNQSSAQTNTSLKSAPGANLSLYITDITVSNGATAGDIRLVEDPAGTPVIKVPKIYMAVNGGAVMAFETPIRLTANKALGYTSTTVTTHSILVNGFIAP